MPGKGGKLKITVFKVLLLVLVQVVYLTIDKITGTGLATRVRRPTIRVSLQETTPIDFGAIFSRAHS